MSRTKSAILLLSLCAAVALCLSFAPVIAAQADPTEFQYNHGLSSVHITQKDLIKIILVAHQLAYEADRLADVGEVNGVIESMTLSYGTSSIKISNFSENLGSNLENLDIPAATGVSYSFNAFGSHPIQSINIDLTDSSRTISVAGTSQEQVGAISAQVFDSFSDYQVTMSGNGFRSFLAGIANVLGALLLGLGYAVFDTKWVLALSSSIVGAIVLCLLHFVSWQELLPGTLVTEQDPSFAIRFAPEISIAGLLFTVVFGLLAVVPLLRSNEAHTEKTPVEVAEE